MTPPGVVALPVVIPPVLEMLTAPVVSGSQSRGISFDDGYWRVVISARLAVTIVGAGATTAQLIYSPAGSHTVIVNSPNTMNSAGSWTVHFQRGLPQSASIALSISTYLPSVILPPGSTLTCILSDADPADTLDILQLVTARFSELPVWAI